jgi:hypothetical protein
LAGSWIRTHSQTLAAGNSHQHPTHTQSRPNGPVGAQTRRRGAQGAPSIELLSV